ncbi:hypothetical protein [Streptomyces sp. NPDC008125]|uniref:hypothetical protein n=1 Tax=Streptomyces sp. NPDC008125 TaxID=3364811 RepID=UPI0036E0557E
MKRNTTMPMPHDNYVTTILAALRAAGLPPAGSWSSNAETVGTYCHLTAVITLDPSSTQDTDPDDVPAHTAWPHGLVLIWEWHTGQDENAPERGAIWQFAELRPNGSNAYPTDLPVHGCASPEAVVEAAQHVIAGRIRPGHFHNFGTPQGWTGGTIGTPWDQVEALEAACVAWGADGA